MESIGKDIAKVRDEANKYLQLAFNSYASHLSHLRPKVLARMHYGAGIGFGTLGDQREARNELLHALRLDPFIAGAYWRLGLTFFTPAFNRYGRQIRDRLYGWWARRRIP